MKHVFIRPHREEFSVQAMCRMLRVHVSGFYAWQREPMSTRAKEDARQTKLIRDAWSDSGTFSVTASCTTIQGTRERHIHRTGWHGWQALRGSPPRSAAGGVPDSMAARLRSSLRIG
jgi:putative transposase